MKKLIKWAAASATAALLFSSLTFAQTTTPPPDTDMMDQGTTTTQMAPGTTTTQMTPVKTTSTGTKVIVVKPSHPPGYRVCYLPTPRHVEGSRLVQRCGPYGRCQEFRISREFDVIAYKDCHVEKYSCTRGYKSFGWYPTKSDAFDAVSRCHRTVSSSVPGEWRVNY